MPRDRPLRKRLAKWRKARPGFRPHRPTFAATHSLTAPRAKQPVRRVERHQHSMAFSMAHGCEDFAASKEKRFVAFVDHGREMVGTC